jgi:glycosyltransferase involved in cell wall biosynthesis
MKIGFDISQTGNSKAGCGYIAYSLIRAFAGIEYPNEYLQYPTFGDFYFDYEWKKSIEFVRKNNFIRGLSHDQFEDVKNFWNHPPANFEEQLGSPDIIHSNNFFCPKGLKKARLVYTLYDLNFITNPDTTTEANRIGCFMGVFRASLYADHIVSISNYTRDHFLSVFPHYPREKISVIPLASRFPSNMDSNLQKPSSLSKLEPEKFWLNVGTLEPRKNQIRLLEAYAKLKADIGDTFPLVFGGGEGWQMENFDDVVRELGLERNVVKLGYVNDAQLHWLYRHCYALVYPSIFEGFGLPILEAMSQGAAVITSNVTSMPEVIGDTGILVNPFDINEIFMAMKKVYLGEINRLQMKKMAFERSKEFSWENTAKRLLDVYKQVRDGSKF